MLAVFKLSQMAPPKMDGAMEEPLTLMECLEFEGVE